MLLFDPLCSSVSCRWTAENVDHILSVDDSMYLSSLQEGVTPDTATLSINNLPKSVCWIAESSEAILFKCNGLSITRSLSFEYSVKTLLTLKFDFFKQSICQI